MRGFLLPLFAGLACLPCVAPLFLILAVGAGAFLALGLLAVGAAVLAGLLAAIALMRRKHPGCATQGPGLE